MLNLPTQVEVQAMRDRSRFDGQPKAITGKYAKSSKTPKAIPMSTADGESVIIEPKAASVEKAIPSGHDTQALDAANATIASLRKQIASLEQRIASMSDGQAVTLPADDGQVATKAKPKRDRAADARRYRALKAAKA